jgi:hypothetical protein
MGGMTPTPTEQQLVDGLRAWTDGDRADQAAAELVIDSEYWVQRLHREGLMTYETNPDLVGPKPLASINWKDAASSEMICSGSQRRLLLLACSLGGGIPVDMRDVLIGMGHTRTGEILQAIFQS